MLKATAVKISDNVESQHDFQKPAYCKYILFR